MFVQLQLRCVSFDYKSMSGFHPFDFNKKELFLPYHLKFQIEMHSKKWKFATNRVAMDVYSSAQMCFSTHTYTLKFINILNGVYVHACDVDVFVYVNARFDNTSWNCRAFNSCVK